MSEEIIPYCVCSPEPEQDLEREKIIAAEIQQRRDQRFAATQQ